MAKKININDEDVEMKKSLFSEICTAVVSLVVTCSLVIYFADMFFEGCGFPIWLVACAAVISWMVFIALIIIIIIIIAVVIVAVVAD